MKSLFEALRAWRERRILRKSAIPDALWRAAVDAQPFLAIYTDEELARLRTKVVLFLSAKSIVGAGGHVVTPLQRTVIALQACVLVLNLDLALYDDFENVVVYPGDLAAPLASTVNFAAGQIRGNNAVVGLATNGAGTLAVKNRAATAVHLVIDVNGYFK